jgi:hypothetical protein
MKRNLESSCRTVRMRKPSNRGVLNRSCPKDVYLSLWQCGDEDWGALMSAGRRVRICVWPARSGPCTEAHSQHGPRALKLLALALLVYGQHQRVLLRAQVQAGHVAQFLDEEWGCRQSEAFAGVRPEAQQFENRARTRHRSKSRLFGFTQCQLLLRSSHWHAGISSSADTNIHRNHNSVNKGTED